MYAYNVNNNNSYAVSIENDKGPFYNFTLDDETYYTLPDNSTYKIKLTNNTASDVHVILKIDGLDMGKFRLYPNYTGLLERPLHNNRQFTFVRNTSAHQSEKFGVVQTAQYNGLVEVTFIQGTLINFNPNNPQINYSNEYISDNSNNSLNAIRVEGSESKSNSSAESSVDSSVESNLESNLESNVASMPYDKGATVLGHISAQKFYAPNGIIEEDPSKQVTMKVRLLLSN
jgi:hypothetical protein